MWRYYCLYLVLWLFLFSLSFSQAEAEEKKKAEERSKRESGKATSFAVSGISPVNPTWHYYLNILQRAQKLKYLLPCKNPWKILTLQSGDDIEMNAMGARSIFAASEAKPVQ